MNPSWAQVVSLPLQSIIQGGCKICAALDTLIDQDDMNPYFDKEVMNAEPLWWKANPKGSGSLPAPRSDHAIADMVCFAHLLILEHLDHH